MNAMPIKPYLEMIAQVCEPLTKEDLSNIISGLAMEKSGGDRLFFLSKIRKLATKSPINEEPQDFSKILEEIDDLIADIENRVSCIENGEYNELDDWDGDDYYDDEGPDFISEDQLNEMEFFFGQADSFFLNDCMNEAATVYKKLFDGVEYVDGLGFNLEKPDIDFREERARYARSVYETCEDSHKVESLSQILTEGMWFPERAHRESHPLLQDVINSRNVDIKDFDFFLPLWREHLAKDETNHRNATLILEAVYLMEGLEGIADLARKWGNRQPLGYVYYITYLIEEAKFTESIDVCTEALEMVQDSAMRFQISNMLINAAEEEDDREMVLRGKNECLLSDPSEGHLLALLKEAELQSVRDHELNQVLEHFENQTELNRDTKALYLKSLLIAGKLDQAFHMVRKENPIGWSYGSNAGLIYGALAFTLSNFSEQAENAKAILKQYGEGVSYGQTKEDGLLLECIKGIVSTRSTQVQLNTYLKWMTKIAGQRIQHIVSNQHRGAYERAAMVLTALAETHVSNGRDRVAKTLILEFCRDKFPRHSAFKGEVHMCINQSPLLKNLINI